MELTTTYHNTSSELYPPTASREERKSLDDLLRFYYPNGPIHKAVALYSGSGISNILSINSSFYRINELLCRVEGRPSYDAQLDTTLVAGGKGFSIPGAMLGALGESIERFSGILFSMETEIKRGTYTDLVAAGVPCIHPDEFPLFAEEQYAQPGFLFDPFTVDSPLGWVQGRRLISGDEVWIPAQLALFFYGAHKGEDVVGYSASSGMACHVTEDAAVYGGITELLERDALMAGWYCRIPPKQIQIDREIDDPLLNRFHQDISGLPGELGCYLHETDIPNTFTVSAIQAAPYLKQYAYFAGAATGVDIDEAIGHGLVEYGQSEAQIRLALAAPARSWARGIEMHFGISADKPASEMTTFLENIGHYGHRVHIGKLQWFLEEGDEIALSSIPRRPFDSAAESLEDLKATLSERGIDPIVIDNTPSQFEQLRVMKVVIPELIQPHVAARAYLGHPRLRTLPVDMGLTDTPLSFSDLAPGPVPFP